MWFTVPLLICLPAVFLQPAAAVSKGSDAIQGIKIPRNKFEVPVVCYYYGWASRRPSPMNYQVEDVPLDMCTFVVLAFAGIDDKTFELKSMIPEYQEDSQRYLNFTNLKTQHLYLKTMLAVGGWHLGGEVFSKMVSTPESRAAFVWSALRWMLDYKFDGLEIIWKYPGYEKRGGRPQDKENFALLLKELKEAFAAHPLYLTAAVPLEENYLDDGYDIPKMQRHVDWFNVLAYDLRGPWNRFTDMHSILYKRAADSPYFQDLTIICQDVKSNGWTRKFDNEAKCPYAFKGDQWVGYEDEESVANKMDFILREKYRGVMVFNNDLDDFRGVCGPKNPLMTVIFNKVGEKALREIRANQIRSTPN